MESSSPSQRIIELDGLRGLAIFLVVLCHYVSNVPHGPSRSWESMIGTALGLGASGVDLFFILSGFLIGGILLESRNSAHFYSTFYLRRFHRIVPLYYLWIAVFAALSTLNPAFYLQKSYWIYLAFLQNYSTQSSNIEFVFFAVTWSLAVEEQFYLLTPLLIRSTQPRLLWKVLLVILALSFVLRVFLVTLFGHAEQNYWGLRAANFWMASRADDLALGMLVALAWRSEPQREWIRAHLSYFRYAVLGCSLLILSTLPLMVKPNFFFGTIFGMPFFSAVFLSFLVIALADKQSIISRACRWWWLRELGKVSYCVYVIHVAVNWMVHKLMGHDTPRFDTLHSISVTLFAFLTALLISEISWRLFEHPIIRRGHRYSY
jgi:peptidoglycan/LPS O-acetylase OafA/YrhL